MKINKDLWFYLYWILMILSIIITVFLFLYDEKCNLYDNFDAAITIVLKHEGKLSDDPSDRGGITNYGISLRYLKSLVASNPELMSEYDKNHDKIIEGYDISNMTLEEAIKIYKKNFWDAPGFGKLKSQLLANKIFDLAVNVGPKKAIEFLQEACNKLHNTNHLSVDGRLGEKTLESVNSLEDKDSEMLVGVIKEISYEYYNYIATRHPAYKKFLKGWLKRASE